MSDPIQSTSPLDQAVVAFVARADRTAHPDGRFDRARRWEPSGDERQDCCALIRRPSAAYPYSLMKHCRSVEHIARLFDVEARLIRRATRKVRTVTRRGGEYYKAVARLDDGRLVSIYDGTTEYRIGETLVQPVRTGHGGGYYVRRTAEGAAEASVPATSALIGAPRVVVKVRAEGQYTVYACDCDQCERARLGYADPVDHEKVAFSRITPLGLV